MENIKEIVADLMECYDGNGIPNQHYIKKKVTELHNIVKNLPVPVASESYCTICNKKVEYHNFGFALCEDCRR